MKMASVSSKDKRETNSKDKKLSGLWVIRKYKITKNITGKTSINTLTGVIQQPYFVSIL
jgi:hypothetical protein